MERGFDFGLTVAVMESTRWLPQAGTLVDPVKGKTLAFTVVPSSFPEPDATGEFRKLRLKLLPNCEIRKLPSSSVRKDLPQGEGASLTGSV
jgi:hypothetical protein